MTTIKAEVVPVNIRLPESYVTVPFIAIYKNGNPVNGMAYYKEDEGFWTIEHSNDHPDSEDITHWIDITFEPNLRASAIELRKQILG